MNTKQVVCVVGGTGLDKISIESNLPLVIRETQHVVDLVNDATGCLC